MAESDAELVRRTRAGDRAAFASLVQRYERPALAVALAILHHADDAQDAVQESFVRAFQRIRRLWSPHKFGAWLMQIVRRQSLSMRRSRATRSRHTLSVAHAGAAIANGPREFATDAVALLARLPAQEYLVASLRHLEDLSVREIADITGRPVGTVTKQLSRAYARMRMWIEEEADHARR